MSSSREGPVYGLGLWLLGGIAMRAAPEWLGAVIVDMGSPRVIDGRCKMEDGGHFRSSSIVDLPSSIFHLPSSIFHLPSSIVVLNSSNSSPPLYSTSSSSSSPASRILDRKST